MKFFNSMLEEDFKFVLTVKNYNNIQINIIVIFVDKLLKKKYKKLFNSIVNNVLIVNNLRN